MLTKERELLLANKLTVFGEVAIGLAHELRQPLTALKGMTQAVMQNPDDQECFADFKLIVPKQLDRLIGLLENLLKFGQLPEQREEPVKINQLLQDTVKLFANRCRTLQIRVIEKLGSLLEVKADPDQLSQVFINLIANAIQAMPKGGELTLITVQKRLSIIIEIIDTGLGIKEKDIKNIFQPFFSTKKQGLGLGLALALKMVRDHCGTLTVESREGAGTKFTIELPLRTLPR
ncbi:MAG: ATP-binding protein [Candidatus Saganbacteria bacterium]|nr:ATP-binding protein [Candidatus Saganbacteria bacterium]